MILATTSTKKKKKVIFGCMGFLSSFFVCFFTLPDWTQATLRWHSQPLDLCLPLQPQGSPAEKHKQSLLHLGAKCRKEAGSASPILKPQHRRGPWYSPSSAQPPRPPLNSQIVSKRGCWLSHSEHLTEISRLTLFCQKIVLSHCLD